MLSTSQRSLATEKLGGLLSQAAELERILGKTSERERDALRKKSGRLVRKVVVIPKCDDPIRRRDLESDDAAWLRWYFGDCSYYTDAVFSYDFQPNQLNLINAIVNATRSGGDDAEADSRGGGKTTIARRLVAKFALTGVISFSVLFAATGQMAEDSLKAIKHDIRENLRLRADYPEICVPVSRAGSTPQLAHHMVASGLRHDTGEPYDYVEIQFSWCGQEVHLANVPGAPGKGAIIATRGLDSAIVGLNKLGKRPGLAIIDDADTDETVYSKDQADKLEGRIDRSIGGLGDQKKGIARVMLCTIRNRNCVAWRFTDRKLKPSWRGKRHSFFIAPPTNKDLWEEYVELLKVDWDQGTEKAKEFFLSRQLEMEAGAVPANTHRFLRNELSAVQHYFNQVARLGHDVVATEYDNAPPEDGDAQQGLILTGYHIQDNCLSGYEKRIVPEGTVAITIGADVQKLGLHWVAIAWNDRGAGCIIDYDFWEFMTQGKKAADCELLILEGLSAWYDNQQAHPFTCVPTREYPEGEKIFADLTLIDMGWKEETWNNQPVEVFCAQVGVDRFRPSKGIPNYKRPKDSFSVIVGDNWHISEIGGIPVVHMNTDHWKLKVHEGFLTDRNEQTKEPGPGALRIYNKPKIDGRVHRTAHLSFAKHILAETWDPYKMRWSEATKANHYFDACYAGCVGRSIQGISVLPPATAPDKPKRSAVISSGFSSQSRW